MSEKVGFIKFVTPLLIEMVSASILAVILSMIVEMTPADLAISAVAMFATFIAMDLYRTERIKA
jgi:hypothetical protein